MTTVSTIQVLMTDALALMNDDPRRLPHPVKKIGKAFIACDRILSRFCTTPAAERILV